jgi:CBS domain-containing protein
MANASLFGSMPVSVLTGEQIVRVGADATLYEVADVMAEAGVGALVVGDGDPPAGIVTERDFVGVLAGRTDPGATQVGHLAQTSLVWCAADATVSEVAELMMTRYVRHVLVEDDGELVGIVSARDLLGAYASEDTDDEEQ